jgi:hypothetical protein
MPQWLACRCKTDTPIRSSKCPKVGHAARRDQNASWETLQIRRETLSHLTPSSLLASKATGKLRGARELLLAQVNLGPQLGLLGLNLAELAAERCGTAFHLQMNM